MTSRPTEAAGATNSSIADVLTYTSAPLDHDVTVTGALSATLFASTSGADAGPAPGAYARSLNGYELPIAMEIRRGRFNQSFETPHALVPNKRASTRRRRATM
jgi:predicted acyl esterase